MTIKVVGSQTTKPTMRGCTGHNAIAEFHSRNQQRNQRQYLALALFLNPRRKSLQTLSTELAPFTLSLTARNASIKEGNQELWLYSDARNILKSREFRIPQYH
jgi:hypothetical protein